MKPCSIEGCTRPFYARGWCGPHYQRWRRHGDPTVYVGQGGRRWSGAPAGPLLVLIRGLNDGAAARRLGVTRGTVWRWRHGVTAVGDPDAMACRLGRHVTEIWTDEELGWDDEEMMA